MWRWEKRKDGSRQLTYAQLLVVGVIFTAVALFLSHGPEKRQILIFGSTPFYLIGAPLSFVAAVTLAVNALPAPRERTQGAPHS
jgi:hypothetical protein